MPFLDGDLSQSEYCALRDDLTGELAMLPQVGNPNSGAGERLAGYLADVSKAWKDATAEERNRIARELFASVTVDNGQAVTCMPRPKLELFSGRWLSNRLQNHAMAEATGIGAA